MKYALLIAVFVLAGAGTGHSQDESQTPETDAESRSEESSAQSIDESELTFDEDSGSAADGGGEGLTSFGAGDFIRMVLVLALVVLSIYVLFYFIRKASGQGARGSRAVRLLGTTPLQGGRSVHLVEVGGRVFLLGSADQSVRLISEIDDQETVDRLLLDYGDGVAVGGFGRRSFPELLGDMFRNSSLEPGSRAEASARRASAAEANAAHATRREPAADSVSGTGTGTDRHGGDTGGESTAVSGSAHTERSTDAPDAHEHVDEAGEPPSFLEVQRSRLRQL